MSGVTVGTTMRSISSGAAPAMAMDRQAAAKSRKRETVEQLQMAGAAGGQQRTLSGMVISGEDEQPLPGVVIAVKGSNTGTVTDLEGKFQISIEHDSQNTLIAQFIGMESKEISIQDQDELMIILEPDVISLEEVVIIDLIKELKKMFISDLEFILI